MIACPLYLLTCLFTFIPARSPAFLSVRSSAHAELRPSSLGMEGEIEGDTLCVCVCQAAALPGRPLAGSKTGRSQEDPNLGRRAEAALSLPSLSEVKPTTTTATPGKGDAEAGQA